MQTQGYKCYECGATVNLSEWKDFKGTAYDLLVIHYLSAHNIDLKNKNWRKEKLEKEVTLSGRQIHVNNQEVKAPNGG